MKKFVSNVSNIRRASYVNDYIAAQYYHLCRCKYTETYYHARSVYSGYKEVSSYESISYGKFGRVFRIMARYDGSFDVSIENTVTINDTMYKSYVYSGNFKTLQAAVKAKYRHYKDN